MNDEMRISWERSGGVAGMTLHGEVDTRLLRPEEAERVRRMVDQAGFFSLPSRLDGVQAGVDRFQHTLTVESGGRRHTVRTTDAAAPESLRPLMEYLTRLAKRPGGQP